MTSDDLVELAIVGRPVSAQLRLPGLGAGIVGAPAPLYVVLREELEPEEWSAIEAGQYLAAFKLYARAGVVGLVLELGIAGQRLRWFLNYSLRHIAEQGTPGQLADTVEALAAFKRDARPGVGLLVSLVFLDLDELQTVRALRAFALPRMFGDRFLSAVERTAEQDLAAAIPMVAALCGDCAGAWSDAAPGVAVAGEELEQTDAEYVRAWRKQRERRRK